MTAQQSTTVYIANKDLNPLTDINEEDFTAISLPTAAVSSDYVLNLAEVINLPLKNSLYQKEILSYAHISGEDSINTKNLLTTVVPNFYDDIKANDIVNVYVIKADKETKIFSMETIFIAKKVEKITDSLVKTNAKEGFAFSVIVDEEELKTYYAAQHAGDIVATRVVNPNLIDIVSNLTTFNPAEIVFNREPVEEKAGTPTTQPPTNTITPTPTEQGAE